METPLSQPHRRKEVRRKKKLAVPEPSYSPDIQHSYDMMEGLSVAGSGPGILKELWQKKHLVIGWATVICSILFLISLSGGGALLPFQSGEVAPASVSTGEASEVIQAVSGLAADVGLDSDSTANSATAAGQKPVRITAKSVGIDTTVSNPTSTNSDVLNDYLMGGAVRFPTSGLLGDGTVLIFAHSTSFGVVNNNAYQAFNGVKDLTSGDIVSVFGQTHEYRYRVTSVELTTDSELIELDDQQNQLVLSTCHVLGQKEDRWVARAELVERLPLDEK